MSCWSQTSGNWVTKKWFTSKLAKWKHQKMGTFKDFQYASKAMYMAKGSEWHQDSCDQSIVLKSKIYRLK